MVLLCTLTHMYERRSCGGRLRFLMSNHYRITLSEQTRQEAEEPAIGRSTGYLESKDL